MALQPGITQPFLTAPQPRIVGLGVVHAGQAKPGVEAAGARLLGKHLRLLLQLVGLPGAGHRLHQVEHRRRGGRFGEQHPEVVAAAAAGIEQQGVVAPLPEGPPPGQGAGQIAAGPPIGAHSIEVVVVDVDAQPATGALLALGMEADQLGSVQAAAGEMARQLVEGHPILTAHLRHRQGHGLVGAAALAGLLGGEQRVLTPHIAAVHQALHGPIGQLAGALLPLLADDLLAGRHQRAIRCPTALSCPWRRTAAGAAAR